VIWEKAANYGHLVPDSDAYVRGLLDAGDRQRLGHLWASTPET